MNDGTKNKKMSGTPSRRTTTSEIWTQQDWKYFHGL